ncbi:hypothetical protein, partial [Burkholderia sola]
GNSAAKRIRNPFKQCPSHQSEALFNSLLVRGDGLPTGFCLQHRLLSERSPKQIQLRLKHSNTQPIPTKSNSYEQIQIKFRFQTPTAGHANRRLRLSAS